MKLVYILFFLSCFCNAQVNRVDYYYRTNNTVDTSGIRTFLIFDKSKSVYIHNSIYSEVIDKTGENENLDIKLTRKIRDTIGFRVYNTYDNDSISVLDKIDINRYSYKEVKNIKWEILDTYKSIAGLECQLAKTSFRGREFEVWFTTEIPISSGPWKFSGLPGLVIEVQDDLRQISFKLKSISYDDKNSHFDDYSSLALKTTLIEFVDRKDNLAKEQLNKILSKLPRKAQGEILRSTSRMGIELSYEWEEEK